MTLSLRWACKIMSWFYIPYQRPKFPSKVCSIKGFVVFFAVLPFAYKLLGSGPCPIWMSISAVMNPIEGPFLAVRGSIHRVYTLYTFFTLYTLYALYTLFTFYTLYILYTLYTIFFILRISATAKKISLTYFSKCFNKYFLPSSTPPQG